MLGSSSDKAGHVLKCQSYQAVSAVEHAGVHLSISIDSAVHFSELLILTEVDRLSNAGLASSILVQTRPAGSGLDLKIGPGVAESSRVALDQRSGSCNSLVPSLQQTRREVANGG